MKPNPHQQFQQQVQRQQQQRRQQAGYAWQQQQQIQQQQEEMPMVDPAVRKRGGKRSFAAIVKYLFSLIVAVPLLGYVGYIVGIGFDNELFGALAGIILGFIIAHNIEKYG